VLLIVAAMSVRHADAFIIDPDVTPWRATASGRRTGNGASGTLTWSIVPDGTPVSDGVGNLGGSDLVAFLNENFDGDPLENDHTAQPWYSILEGAFNRWSEVSGLSFVYEPNDDGRNHSDRRGIGVLGTRGDVRIAGASIDGSGGTLAFNFLPEFGGDMVRRRQCRTRQ
jgi:hypothetical protein